jgi:hypothetical protein
MRTTHHDLAFTTRFALASLATWRITHLLAAEDGPAGVVARARARLGDTTLGEAMDCFNCLSVWISVPAGLAVAGRGRHAGVTCLAISGAACLLEELRAAGDEQPAG